MLNHQNIDAQVKPLVGPAEVVPQLGRLHGLVRLFPESDLGQFVVVPTVTDDAVPAWPFAGEIVGLRGASDSGKRRVDERPLAKREKLSDRRGVRANVPLSQPDDVENGSAFHGDEGQARAGMTDCSRPAWRSRSS